MTQMPRQAFEVTQGQDRLREHHDIGIGTVAFKVATQDSHGELLVVELNHHTKGGPGRHFHYEQDEWFYILEGQYIFEVQEERFRLRTGDSMFIPRVIPHVWAYAGGQPGRILITFNPAGPMEAFFRETTKANAMPPLDPVFFRTYGMELIGPPLALDSIKPVE